jgi:hypothetical protein
MLCTCVFQAVLAAEEAVDITNNKKQRSGTTHKHEVTTVLSAVLCMLCNNKAVY